LPHLPHIARLTKRLRVPALVSSAAHDGDDVVKHELMGAAAPLAGFGLPLSALKRSEVSAVSQEFSCPFLTKMGASRKHHVAVLSPSAPVRFGDLSQSFRRVLVALGWAGSLLCGSSAFGFSDALNGRLIVGAPPERIVFPHPGFASAFGCSTGHALGASQVSGVPVDHGAADHARHFAASAFGAGFLAQNGISHNGVKSVKTPLCHVNVIRAIPSQATQECVEGVTTRAWSPDRTVKPHERTARKGRDSLSYAVTHRSGDKEPRDNTSDEVINITPNSPISAAQFSISQYAAAVSMSGLEMLQNSGEEAIIDLMEGRIKVAEAQLQNRIDYDLYQDGTGNGGKDLTGLASAVSTTPTGTYGGILRSTWGFWANQTYSGLTDGGAAVSAVNIQQYMTSLALECVRGRNKPDLWVAAANYFAFYVNSLQAIQRISSSDGSASAGAGFGPELKFYGGGMAADVVMGGGINGDVDLSGNNGGATASRMWALNTDYIFFRPHRDRNFVPIGGERQAVNQDAIVKLIGWAGNLTSSGPQFCGVLSA
jgi:hypothetical protein